MPFLLAAVHGATPACEESYGDCTKSRCCANDRDRCYWKYTTYAQCRPDCDGEHGKHTTGWLCELPIDPPPPPPPPIPKELLQCSERHAECTAEPSCCRRPDDGCFRRPTKAYAQCRPMPKDAPCVDGDWLCPGWRDRLHPSPPPPRPPFTCSCAWTESHACAGSGTPGSLGWAEDDGSPCYAYCCRNLHLHTSETEW